MPSDGHRVTDTIRAKFSGNHAADVPPGGGGSHAVPAGSAGSTSPSDSGRDATQVLPPVGGPSDRESTQVLRPDADRHRGTDRDAPAAVSRKEVVAAQRARYGGIHWGPAFFGWLSANGLAVLLVALLSAGGVAVGLTQGVSADEAISSAAGIGLGGGIGLLVVLFLAYLAGGYVAGRMSRFDGAKQGIAVWVIGLLVVLLLALAGLVFGSQYNVLARLDLPRIPINEGTATTAGIIALVAVLVATLVGAVLGGILGGRYHKKVDRVGFDAVHAGR
ncbi:hypothetical protein [Modestobacter marinus]|uniref:hypothetical protein n=1 Tax=Modestobacter marinus TaxID=477641 RepID=UPI0021BBEA60|nr:hypothetical protein [Modestobacter marinus]